MSNRKMTPYLATGLAEGFEEGTSEEKLEAWAYLIKTGMCWTLQGWFGRQAQAMIDRGYINADGEIDWQNIEEASLEL